MEFTHPFDNAQGHFYILQNARQHYSLWPAQCPLPQGWQVISEPVAQAECYAWLTTHWQTLTPAHSAIRSGE